MAINKIEIKNFTVFHDVSIDFNSGVNVIIGENGTGKTHLLKTLYAFCNSEFSYATLLYEALPIEYFNLATHRDILKNNSECAVIFDDCPESYKKIPTPSIYIPAKDMLTHSKGLLEMTKKYRKDMPFDKTLLDIIEKSRQWKLDEIPLIAKNIIPKLENIIEGKIIFENDTFFVQKSNGKKINFSLEAEGIKKFGLLWQLIMNESITENSILLWDEPEANINPKLIPALVEIILELSRNGVQVFITTHDYILAKYFEVKRKENDSVLFHSLYKTDNGIQCESNENFRDLKNNSLIAAFDELMDEVIDRNIGD